MRRGSIFLAVVVAACGGARPVRHPGEEYLSKIKIEHNTAIGTKELVEGLALQRAEKAGRGVDDYELTVDQQRIEGVYQRRGYLAVAVQTRVERKGDAATVIFTVNERERAKTHVEIIGLPDDVPLDSARKLVALDEDELFDYDAYDAAKQPLLRLIQDAGYARARLEATVIADRGHALATAQYAIEPGEPCTFGEVEVVGASGALAKAVRDRVAFKPGEHYSKTAVIATQQALYGLNRFSSVRVDSVIDGTATTIPIKIGVSTGNRHEFQIGGGGGIDPLNYSILFPAKYSVTGWPFDLSTSSVDARAAITTLRTECTIYKFWTCSYQPLVRLIGTVVQQDLFAPYVVGQVDGGADYVTIEPWRTISAHAKIGLSSRIVTPRLQAHLGWLLEGAEFAQISPAIDPARQHSLGIDRTELLGEYQESLSLDLRDNLADPHLGLYVELRLAEGTKYAGSAYDFIQFSPEIRGFVPLGPLVLATRFRYGAIAGDIPPTERYFGGGASSQRGFPERQLSPIATNVVNGMTESVIIGGGAFIETGAELRSPTIKHFGLVAFLDGGDVTETSSELSIDQLNWTVGLGARFFLLPVGPFRLDFSYRTGHDRPDQPTLGHFNWFFSVGEAF